MWVERRYELADGLVRLIHLLLGNIMYSCSEEVSGYYFIMATTSTPPSISFEKLKDDIPLFFIVE